MLEHSLCGNGVDSQEVCKFIQAALDFKLERLSCRKNLNLFRQGLETERVEKHILLVSIDMVLKCLESGALLRDDSIYDSLRQCNKMTVWEHCNKQSRRP